jgi:ADP-ribosylglycohydrolase
MIGAVIGDVIGSVYEWNNCKQKDFPLFVENSTFTDDSVLTFAVAHSILSGDSYARSLQDFARSYPNRGYGGGFSRWIRTAGDPKPYNSYGNGSAMRVSPVGFAFDTLAKTLEEAKKSAECSHNHAEGIKGAMATASAIYMARTGSSKIEIKNYISEAYNYDLNRTVNEIRPTYEFNETCQGTVPEAIIAFLESTDFEDAIRTAVSLGGDTDTLTCITGGIAQAFYGTDNIPKPILQGALDRLDPELLDIVLRFNEKYIKDSK